jgi:tetratricopeptide (TPR) repeat protein
MGSPAAPVGLKQLVFIAMPFGVKKDPRLGVEIDFNSIYENGIKPAFEGLPVEYIRADEERGGGLIHQQMFERLLLAEVAIVDVTSDNANVFYELGIRHAARPQSTIIMSANAGLPFDINMMRTIIYKLEDGKLTEEAGKNLAEAIAKRLQTALLEGAVRDSPLFELIPNYKGIAPLGEGAAQTFREREAYLNALRGRLTAARRKKADGLADVIAIEDELGPINDATSEMALDLILSYRDIATPEAYDRLIALVEKMPERFRDDSIPVRQQYALTLNRRNRGDDRHRAIEVLEGLLEQYGDSPETCGMLGRIYKDFYTEAAAARPLKAAGFLETAIAYYRRGFNADPRDFFPGVNLVTLLTMEGSDASIEERKRVSPAVAFAVARQDETNKGDYWTIATKLELAIHSDDWVTANVALKRIFGLPALPTFYLQSTTRQLLIVRGYEPRDIDLAKLDETLFAMLEELTPVAAAALVPLMKPAMYTRYREALSGAALAEFDAASAATKPPA